MNMWPFGSNFMMYGIFAVSGADIVIPNDVSVAIGVKTLNFVLGEFP